MRSLNYLFFLTVVFIVSCTSNNDDLLAVNNDDFKTIHSDFKLSSIAIKNGVLLDDYKCEQKVNDVENSIPLSWENVPDGTKSLAVVAVAQLSCE